MIVASVPLRTSSFHRKSDELHVMYVPFYVITFGVIRRHYSIAAPIVYKKIPLLKKRGMKKRQMNDPIKTDYFAITIFCFDTSPAV